jgi:hypothetical protein
LILLTAFPPTLLRVGFMEAAVRRRTSTFFLFLMASIVLVSVTPRIDLPETSYNEADTPVNQMSRVVSHTAWVPVRLPITPVALARHASVGGKRISRKSLKQASPFSLFFCDRHSLRDLLCTFLV